jgi:hypothetical protein
MNIHAENQLRYKTPQETSDDISGIIGAKVANCTLHKLECIYSENELEMIGSEIINQYYEETFKQLIHSIGTKFQNQINIETNFLIAFILDWQPDFAQQIQTSQPILH